MKRCVRTVREMASSSGRAARSEPELHHNRNLPSQFPSVQVTCSKICLTTLTVNRITQRRLRMCEGDWNCADRRETCVRATLCTVRTGLLLRLRQLCLFKNAFSSTAVIRCRMIGLRPIWRSGLRKNTAFWSECSCSLDRYLDLRGAKLHLARLPYYT